jgi:hypothetical protein
MQKWEYLVLQFEINFLKGDMQEVEIKINGEKEKVKKRLTHTAVAKYQLDLFNELGEQGWEPVFINALSYTFKRLKQE